MVRIDGPRDTYNLQNFEKFNDLTRVHGRVVEVLNGLIFKLFNKKCSKYLLKLIYNMISNRSFKLMVNGIISKQFTKELQQGTVNLPIMFNLSTADILRVLNKIKDACASFYRRSYYYIAGQLKKLQN